MDELDLSKRYWLFAYGYHLANGGLEDCRGSFETVDDAHRTLSDNVGEWFLSSGSYHILDVQARRIVDEGGVDFPAAPGQPYKISSDRGEYQ